jgi:hypothetical protein
MVTGELIKNIEDVILELGLVTSAAARVGKT